MGFRSPLAHAIILVLISLPYAINLGKSSIWDANEAFYAETPREMLVSGDYLAPHFNFQPRAQKPPLTYWAVLLSYKLFGVSEFAVRLPSALAAIGVILFSYALARLLFSPRAALIAGIVTATTARVFILARRLPIDILLLFFLTGALYFLVRALLRNDKRSWAFACVFLSLGFLTKGPVALCIPAAAYVLWALWSRRFRIGGSHLLMGAVIFAAIVLPWYILIYRAHGWTYIAPFFLKDNLGRFAAETFGPARGPLYYVSVYAVDFFPWSLLVLAALLFLWRRRKTEEPLRSLSFGLPLVWCAVTFLLFSLSKNKQEYYIAPLYPAAAVILAGVLDRFLLPQDQHSRNRWFTGIYVSFAALLLGMAILIPFALKTLMPHLAPVLHYGPSIFLAAGFALLWWTVVRRKHVESFAVFAGTLWFIFLVCSTFYLPALEPFRPVKEFCRIIDGQSDGNAQAGFFRTAVPSMVFYLRRPIFEEAGYEQMLQRLESQQPVFCILNRNDYAFFAERQNLKTYVLARRARFSVRLSTLLNAGYSPGEELILISNRPFSEKNRSGDRPIL